MFTSKAQDLLSNASFEKCNLCPTKLGSFNDDVIYWTSPTLGSTDYFNSCSPLMGTPENFNGQQQAQSGTAYAGFYLYAPEDYREYVQTSLNRPLLKDVEYKLTFYLSRAERSDFAIRDIGILLTDRELAVNTKKTLTKKHWFGSGIKDYNYLEFKGENYWQQTRKWVKVEVRFRAKGTERFLIVGNFKPNARTMVRETTRSAKRGAYYYIDSFDITEIAEAPLLAKNEFLVGSSPLALNKSHRFENVLFEFDRYMLLDSAKADIKKVFSYLEHNSDLHIQIDGHTDNIGSALYNRTLSDHRCQAVVEYLLQLGLSKERISWRAHGGAEPIADNRTDEGRKLNRRVEFVLVRNESPN